MGRVFRAVNDEVLRVIAAELAQLAHYLQFRLNFLVFLVVSVSLVFYSFEVQLFLQLKSLLILRLPESTIPGFVSCRREHQLNLAYVGQVVPLVFNYAHYVAFTALAER